jgi:hypothetical protein
MTGGQGRGAWMQQPVVGDERVRRLTGGCHGGETGGGGYTVELWRGRLVVKAGVVVGLTSDVW